MSNEPTVDFRSEMDASAQQPRGRRQVPWIPGVTALALALVGAIVQVVAIASASALNWELGALLAQVSIGLNIAATLVGLLAVILNRGRRWGVIAMVLGVIANPLVLVALFRLLA